MNVLLAVPLFLNSKPGRLKYDRHPKKSHPLGVSSADDTFPSIFMTEYRNVTVEQVILQFLLFADNHIC